MHVLISSLVRIWLLMVGAAVVIGIHDDGDSVGTCETSCLIVYSFISNTTAVWNSYSGGDFSTRIISVPVHINVPTGI